MLCTYHCPLGTMHRTAAECCTFVREFDADISPAILVHHCDHARLPATFHVPQKMRRSRGAGELTLTLALLALPLALPVLLAVAFIADIFSHADSMVTGSTAAQLHPTSSCSFSAGRDGKGGGDSALAPEGDRGSISSARALAGGCRTVRCPIQGRSCWYVPALASQFTAAGGSVSGVHDHMSPFLLRLIMTSNSLISRIAPAR